MISAPTRVARAGPHAQLALVRDAGLGEPRGVACRPGQLGGGQGALVRAPRRRRAVEGAGGLREDLRPAAPGRRRRGCRPSSARSYSATASSNAMRLVAAVAASHAHSIAPVGDARDRRFEVVVGERLDRRPRTGVEQLRDLAVQPDPLVRGELLEQCLAHERVREAQPARAALDLVDELGVDGFVELVDRGSRRRPA